MSPTELSRVAREFDIFAHLTPDQKEAIIKALRARGHVVGYMGDGINDAAAMKASDVGISVDTAVDVAKESADIIPLDKVDPKFAQSPQAWDISFIRRFLFRIGPISSLFDYATFALMWFVFGCSAWIGGDADVKLHAMRLFNTGWFVESLLTQTLIVHIIRTNRVPFFQSSASVPLLLSTAVVMAMAIALPYTPLGSLIGLVPLPAAFWPIVAGFLTAYAVITHFAKTRFNRKHGGLLNAKSA
jgi:magnesium-transporting ATPase (P-type)